MAKAVRKRRRTKRCVFVVPECVPNPHIVSRYPKTPLKHSHKQDAVTRLEDSPTRNNPQHLQVAQGRQDHPTRMFARSARLLPTRLILYRQTYHTQPCTSHQAMRANAHRQLRFPARPLIGSRRCWQELELWGLFRGTALHP